MDDAHHLEAIGNLAGTTTVDEGHAICQRQLRLHDFQVTELQLDILCLDDTGPHDVQDIETLGELRQVAEVGDRAGPLADVEARDAGGSARRRDGEVAVPHTELAWRPLEREIDDRRRFGDRRFDQAAIEPHHLAALVDRGASLAIAGPRLCAQHPHADRFQHA